MTGYTYSPIVKTANINGMWIKIDKKHINRHFLLNGQDKTLCGVSILNGIVMITDTRTSGFVVCPTCKKKLLEMEPAMKKILEMDV